GRTHPQTVAVFYPHMVLDAARIPDAIGGRYVGECADSQSDAFATARRLPVFVRELLLYFAPVLLAKARRVESQQYAIQVSHAISGRPRQSSAISTSSRMRNASACATRRP